MLFHVPLNPKQTNPSSTPDVGPHGGVRIRTGEGFVEISVFESGVPPHFRLYFFSHEKQPHSPENGTVVMLETLRPGGERQGYSFVLDEDYLRSTTDIPEPHEFQVFLRLTRQGDSHVYKTQFTEEAHGHSHDHAGHSHHQGDGILGRILGLFGHSHSVIDKIDRAIESNEKGISALKISLVGLGATALIQAIIAVASGSVGLLADTIHNFADAGTSLPLWVAFALAKRGASRRFTYGYGKVEDVAGVGIVLIIFLSACVAAWESVRKLLHPQPVEHLGWVIIAALVGFVGNEAVAVFRIRVGKEIGSAALVADGMHARVDGFTSLAVLIGVFGVWVGIPMLDPLVGIGITLAILFIVKDAAASVWVRLIDGIEPEILDEIAHAPLHVAGVKGIASVRARWVGHTVHADVEIRVDPNITAAAAHEISTQVERSLREHIRLLGQAVVRALPDDASSIAGATDQSGQSHLSSNIEESPR